MKCDYCDKELYPGNGRTFLANRTIICDECLWHNEHIKHYPDVTYYWTGVPYLSRKYYYIKKDKS